VNPGSCRNQHTSARMRPDRVGEPGGIPIRHPGGTKARKSAEMLRVGGDVWRRLSGVRTAQLHPVPLVRKCPMFWVFASSRPLFRALEPIPIPWNGYL
jgi:hypothetical protein